MKEKLLAIIKKKLPYMGIGILILLAFLAPFFLSSFWIFVIGYALITSIVGLGFNLLLGYNGLLSLGHAAFFSIGAYTFTILMRMLGIKSFELLLLIALAATILFALSLGFISLRHIKIYFVLITLAFNQTIFALIYKLYWLTRGSDGLTVPAPSILGMHLDVPKAYFINFCFFYYILALFIALTVIMWFIVNSPFGRVLKAIKDNAIRVEFLGMPVWKYRLIAFIISCIYASIGGVLFAVFNGFISPDYTSLLFSSEIVFLTILGGTGVFWGPIIGAFLYSIIRIYLVTITIYWQLILGVVLIILIINFRKGVAGTLTDLFNKWKGVK